MRVLKPRELLATYALNDEVQCRRQMFRWKVKVLLSLCAQPISVSRLISAFIIAEMHSPDGKARFQACPHLSWAHGF